MAGFNPVFDPTAQGPFDWAGEGQEKYENGRRYVMHNGQWVDYGLGAPPVMPVDNNVPPWGTGPKPGGGGGDFTSMADRMGLNKNPISNIPMPSEEPSLTQTGPKEGDTQSVGGITLRFTNGKWVEPGTTTGGLGGTNMAQNPNPDASIWEVDPRQAYLNQLGIGAFGLTPYQQWQKGQFNPTYATYLAQSQLNPAAQGQTAGTFGDYLGQRGIQGARQAAPGLLNQVGGLAPEQERGFWENLGGFANELVENALRQRFGSPIASQMGQNFGAIQSAFQGGPGYTDTGSSFLSYLRQKYGL